ncbi:MAG: BatD family protein [Bacteroidota bacterium]|nr:BatD family protein [Bacteroidota bacterium]
MKRTVTIFFFLLLVVQGQAQLSFKTIVPQQPVIAGESFQVQYIIEDGDNTMNVKPPVFSHFRFVAGPHLYRGSVASVNGSKPLRNAVYTLEAVKPGRFVVQGATIIINGKTIRSNDALVLVISKEEADRKFDKENRNRPSDYFLRPGEDAFEKIRQNLFVKVMVDKKACFVGEPVLATFKLYSRLESKSDIVKNPGFYGFTVYDMVNLSDKQKATENINGKLFDVHTIRKVQLYPLQAGVFTIDAMEVKNKVEFSKSAVNRKTEQEIIEGVLSSNENETPVEGIEVFETDISTAPVIITVKPVPVKNQPTDFNGATGRFTIAAALVKSKLSRNEEGLLAITVSGKGNFIQLSAPPIQWPAGTESFEPTVKDDLDKTSNPLTGSRTFLYLFVCTKPGKYQLPRVSFSFFDTDSNNYKTIATKNLELLVGNELKKIQVAEKQQVAIGEKSEKTARTTGIVVLLLGLLILSYWVFRKKEPETVPLIQKEEPTVSVSNLLEPAYAAIPVDDNGFYSILHGIIWKFAADKFALSGSAMSKQVLTSRMKEAGIAGDIIENLFQLLNECEAGMFTNASLLPDKKRMMSEAKVILEKINA